MKPIAVNRKAKFDYFISEKFEAGLCLQGHEVKSLREGRVNLRDSFVKPRGRELFLVNCHITPYSRIQGYVELEPTRSRKILLHKAEINRILGLMSQKGLACVPLQIYFKKGYAKVEIGIGKGKQSQDKRETIKRRIHNREAEAAMKKYAR